MDPEGMPESNRSDDADANFIDEEDEFLVKACATVGLIFGAFVTRFLYDLVEKIISSSVLSPTAIASFDKGALVQPQPGVTLVILRVSSPVEWSQKTWLIFEC